MATKPNYEKMTVAEFIETDLFKEHLEEVLNSVLLGYNEYDKKRVDGQRFKASPLINLIEEGLLDDTEKFMVEVWRVLGLISERPSGQRKCIEEIVGEAIHSALASLKKSKK